MAMTQVLVPSPIYLSGPPPPKFEENMNYVHPSPPISMKKCIISATVKFHMELLLTTLTWKQSCGGLKPLVFLKHCLFSL